MIRLPFPPASLSGHAKGHWRAKAAATKQWRDLTCKIAKAAKLSIPADGDIRVRVTFVPPDRRSDRTNFANRCKPIFDGLADALGVNDRRFLPAFHYMEPQKPGWLIVEIDQ